MIILRLIHIFQRLSVEGSRVVFLVVAVRELGDRTWLVDDPGTG